MPAPAPEIVALLATFAPAFMHIRDETLSLGSDASRG
jgi:hypothetical protein